MKIIFQITFTAALAVLPFLRAQAQITVVKQDGNKIYLDISEHNRRISIGDNFKIILSREKLTNPKTGKDLGFINHYSEQGTIIEVQPLYAVGQTNDENPYQVGQEAIIQPLLSERAGVSQQTSVKTEKSDIMPPTDASSVSPRKIQTYTALPREIISAVKADLNAFPGEEFAALDAKGYLVVYTPEGDTLRQTAEYKLPGGKKPITLSSSYITGAENARLFAVVYDEHDRSISTLVFDATDTQIHQTDSLPYFVKEIGCDENKKLYAQKPFIQAIKPGDPRELLYAEGKFLAEGSSFAARGNWLTGLNYQQIQTRTSDNLVYTASNGRLRMKLDNGKLVDSPPLFATAPNRVKYKQDIISFYPSLQAYGPAGRITLAAVENTAKLGLLSRQFGQYNGSNIHFLTYENGVLDVKESLHLNGFLYDTNCTERGILAPQVLSDGQTILTEIYR